MGPRRASPGGSELDKVPALSDQPHDRARDLQWHQPIGTAGSTTGAAAIIGLQRAAGNQAVAAMLRGARRRADDGGLKHRRESEPAPPEPQPEPEPDAEAPVPAAAADAGGTRWGVADQPPAPNLFGRQPGSTPARRANPFGADVQRFTTTDGLIANVASLVGLGSPAAAATGAVTFESSGFSGAVAKALAITKGGTDLTIDSQTYTASGTVKASGPKNRIGNYEIGFLQTVYESSRNFYYEPAAYTPGLLAQLAPTFFGERKKISDTISTRPVRDGDAGKRPWYGMETVDQFAKTDPSTKTSTMSDTPGTSNPWTTGSAPKQQHLVKTDGHDRFRSWLAVKDKSSQSAIPLNYADWEVDYGTTVAFNKASPAASVVTPTATSGSKVTGTGDGTGGKWPLHDDPVANDVSANVNSLW